MRLLSYNIQTGIASTRFRHYLTHSWKHLLPHAEGLENLDKIARLISEFDIVALQEVDAGSLRSRFINQAEYLARRGNLPYWYCQTNRNLGHFAQNSNALLSKYRPHVVSEYKLPGLPGRGVIMAHYGGGKGASLVFLLIHLALGQRARLRQLGFISELVNEYEHVVLMGDLNCRPGSREMDTLFRNTRLREPAQCLNTFPSWRPQRNIDHILVTPELETSNVRVLRHSFSDHLPIALEMTLPDGVTLTR
ncbi:MAG TPA: endonuclease/exonuclease/phosphatase family protein [Gammaproteobacteria bacterium]|nr:endonuclease/exonuclease/phosphatase family protein [Gammaproteobacteria bacterium]